MNHGTANKLAGELAALIEQLIDKQVALRNLVQQKLQAMRRCDAEEMLRVSQREGDLTGEVAALEGKRTGLVVQMCAALDISARADAKGVSLRTLISKLDQQSGRLLAGVAERLRGEMLKLAEANRVVQLVCQEMMAHFKAIFAAMVQSEHDAPTYSARGEVGAAVGARVLDATG